MFFWRSFYLSPSLCLVVSLILSPSPLLLCSPQSGHLLLPSLPPPFILHLHRNIVRLFCDIQYLLAMLPAYASGSWSRSLVGTYVAFQEMLNVQTTLLVTINLVSDTNISC